MCWSKARAIWPCEIHRCSRSRDPSCPANRASVRRLEGRDAAVHVAQTGPNGCVPLPPVQHEIHRCSRSRDPSCPANRASVRRLEGRDAAVHVARPAGSSSPTRLRKSRSRAKSLPLARVAAMNRASSTTAWSSSALKRKPRRPAGSSSPTRLRKSRSRAKSLPLARVAAMNRASAGLAGTGLGPGDRPAVAAGAAVVLAGLRRAVLAQGEVRSRWPLSVLGAPGWLALGWVLGTALQLQQVQLWSLPAYGVPSWRSSTSISRRGAMRRSRGRCRRWMCPSSTAPAMPNPKGRSRPIWRRRRSDPRHQSRVAEQCAGRAGAAGAGCALRLLHRLCRPSISRFPTCTPASTKCHQRGWGSSCCCRAYSMQELWPSGLGLGRGGRAHLYPGSLPVLPHLRSAISVGGAHLAVVAPTRCSLKYLEYLLWAG